MTFVQPAGLPGCYAIDGPVHRDGRGVLVTTFRRDALARLGLVADYPEQFYSRSKQGVLRGLHFQLPPMEHAKLVACLRGEVFDVLVDLRTDSPAFGRHVAFELREDDGRTIYMPPGIAHGFYARSEAVLLYGISTPHSPPHDAGIRWDSVGIGWPDDRPLMSERDRQLPPFSAFASPFRMAPPRSGGDGE